MYPDDDDNDDVDDDDNNKFISLCLQLKCG